MQLKLTTSIRKENVLVSSGAERQLSFFLSLGIPISNQKQNSSLSHSRAIAKSFESCIGCANGITQFYKRFEEPATRDIGKGTFI